jgi:hypothetical protein
MDGIQNLAALKTAIYDLAANIDETHNSPATSEVHPDSATALKIVSSIHRGTIITLHQVRRRLPQAWHHELIPGGGTMAHAEHKLRDKAVTLVKEELLKDMRQLQHEELEHETPSTKEPAEAASQQDPPPVPRRIPRPHKGRQEQA